MSITTGRILVALCALAIVLVAMSCSQQETAQLEPPTYYADSVLSQVRDHIRAGYEVLDSGSVDSAVAEFAKISDLVQTGVVREYHTACAYARSGEADEAFNWLNRLVANGYDDPEQLGHDPDFESIADDPRFETIIQKAEENAQALTEIMAGGLPEYEKPPQAFETEEDFESWYDDQRQTIRSHRTVWTSADHQTAMLDLAAKKLAALRELKADDPEFDYGLERIRETSRMSSMYDTWGPVTDLVMSEYNRYQNGSPEEPGLSEANYRAGLALTLQYGEDDTRLETNFTEANTYLERVEEGTEYYGAARALAVINKLRLPDADEATLGEELMSVVDEYGRDQVAYRIISTQYGPNTVHLTWPVEIDKADIDNQQVELSDYDGKAVLIDFWATWCPPCRAELPNLLEQYETYHPKGFEVVSISLDYEDRVNLEDYREWIEEKGMNWRHIYDGQGWDTPLVKKYFVSSIPAPFMVGTDGSLVAWGADCRGEDLKGAIEKALGI
jgi:thiol-disulfide isomerase/thioredoxin